MTMMIRLEVSSTFQCYIVDHLPNFAFKTELIMNEPLAQTHINCWHSSTTINFLVRENHICTLCINHKIRYKNYHIKHSWHVHYQFKQYTTNLKKQNAICALFVTFKGH